MKSLMLNLVSRSTQFLPSLSTSNNNYLTSKHNANYSDKKQSRVYNYTMNHRKQDISKEGLAFLSKLSRPNFNNDLARSINLWV